MKPPLFGLTLVAFLAGGAASAQTPFVIAKCDPNAAVIFSNIRLPQPVLADGKPLAAGTYDIRITNEHPTPAPGQSVSGECWVEFVKTGTIAGRELASVVPADEIGSVVKGPTPKPSACRVDVLKEGEYLRLWMNDAGTHYIVKLPISR
jgi:hypothetical protein